MPPRPFAGAGARWQSLLLPPLRRGKSSKENQRSRDALGPVAYQATHKRHRHLFEQVCSIDNLLAAARKAWRGKAWRGKRSRPSAATFYARFEDEVVALRSELLNGTYEHGAYHYYQIHDLVATILASHRDTVEQVLEPGDIPVALSCASSPAR